jgi:hypothetical protein
VTFCRFCGKPLPSGSKCPSCGWSENAVSQAAGRAEAAEKAAGIEVPAEDHPLYQFTDIEGNVSISDDKYDFVAREGELKRDGMLTDFKPPIYKFIDSDGKLWESNVKDPPLPYPGAVLTAAEEAADRADAGGIAAKDAASATSGAFGPAAARAAQAASSTGLSKTQLAVVIAVITLLAGGGYVLMGASNPQSGGGGKSPAQYAITIHVNENPVYRGHDDMICGDISGLRNVAADVSLQIRPAGSTTGWHEVDHSQTDELGIFCLNTTRLYETSEVRVCYPASGCQVYSKTTTINVIDMP